MLVQLVLLVKIQHTHIRQARARANIHTHAITTFIQNEHTFLYSNINLPVVLIFGRDFIVSFSRNIVKLNIGFLQLITKTLIICV